MKAHFSIFINPEFKVELANGPSYTAMAQVIVAKVDGKWTVEKEVVDIFEVEIAGKKVEKKEERKFIETMKSLGVDMFDIAEEYFENDFAEFHSIPAMVKAYTGIDLQ